MIRSFLRAYFTDIGSNEKATVAETSDDDPRDSGDETHDRPHIEGQVVFKGDFNDNQE